MARTEAYLELRESAGAGLSPHANRLIGTKLTVAAGMALAAGGLGVLAQATPSAGYTRVLAALLLAGSGIGLAMAPATDSVMGSLPLAKAGVGSAMNDTARLLGAAFGVAVLGTIINEAYRSHIAASAPAPARGSLQAALTIAQLAGGPRGLALRDAARRAFTDAMSRASLAGVLVAVTAALVALALLPARPRHAAEGRTGGGSDRRFHLALTARPPYSGPMARNDDGAWAGQMAAPPTRRIIFSWAGTCGGDRSARADGRVVDDERGLQ